ncbi:hypothetical protein B0H13DRAFT_2323248 [Mycena leptocephala]|nr:hypothetical protein B0H13DRAFT_2323248 [Mycena leptocephala]
MAGEPPQAQSVAQKVPVKKVGEEGEDDKKPKRGRKRKEPAAAVVGKEKEKDNSEPNSEAVADGEPPAKKAKPASMAGAKPAVMGNSQ